MNVLLLLKNLSRFGGHPLYDSLHSSTKLLILIDSDYTLNELSISIYSTMNLKAPVSAVKLPPDEVAVK